MLVANTDHTSGPALSCQVEWIPAANSILFNLAFILNIYITLTNYALYIKLIGLLLNMLLTNVAFRTIHKKKKNVAFRTLLTKPKYII